MKVVICGGRDFRGGPKWRAGLREKLTELGATEVVCGMARGADLFGKEVAESMGLPVKEFPANWKRYGKSAGPIRNVQMAEYADAVIALPGGRGTGHMIVVARERGKPLYFLAGPRGA